MNTQTGPEDTIAEEAIAWLISLRDTAPAPGSPYQDPSVRSEAFFDWLKRSPAHLRIFMEYMELERRVRQLDTAVFAGTRRLSEIQELSDVPLAVRENPAPDVQVAVSDASPAAQGSPALEVVAHTKFLRKRRWAIAGAIAAGCAAIAVVAYYFPSGSQIYSTHIGGQQRQILQDGSVIQLNTNSQVEVNFSKKVRAIRLIRGEAFFSVKHSSSYWPFIVTAADTSLRAVGTEFDVRQTARSVAVAVVSGTVQAAVEPHQGKAPTVLLSGGEIATFSSGKVTKVVGGNVDDALSWRQNRLVFDRARLSDVAEAFNRYNHVQIRVEGTVAQDIRLTGIFDTGGYRDALWYAQAKEHLLVSPDGENWVIRSHE
jgi:ferric-dicitrate binding protein FerR (iron transport regulator)